MSLTMSVQEPTEFDLEHMLIHYGWPQIRRATRPKIGFALFTHHAAMLDFSMNGGPVLFFNHGWNGPRLISSRQFTSDPLNVAYGTEVSWSDVPAAVDRVRLVLSGKWKYSFLGRNCEHVTSFVLTGNFISQQVNTGIRLAQIALAFAEAVAVASSLDRPKSYEPIFLNTLLAQEDAS